MPPLPGNGAKEFNSLKILIVAATRAELDILKTAVSVSEIYSEGCECWHWEEKTFDVLFTGVGMVATAYALGQQLAQKQYDLIINAGIAGSFDRAVPLGTVFAVQSDCLVELGAEDGDDFLSIEEMGFGKSRFQASAVPKHSYPTVAAVTVNKVHGNESSIHRLLQKHQVQLESMEGAAVFYVCEQEKQAVMQLRSVSNWVERRNREAWDIPLAIKKLNEELLRLLRELL